MNVEVVFVDSPYVFLANLACWRLIRILHNFLWFPLLGG